jgi:tetratricopeptide (TPR) repeat protein
MRALDISPTFVRSYYEVAQAYLNKKDYDKAYEWFAKAAELNPDVGVTYWYMAMADIERGRTVEGLDTVAVALQKGYQLRTADAQRLVGVYYKMGDYESMAILYERLIEQDPKNAQYWVQLAVVYAKLGRTRDAVSATNRALELDSSAKFQAEAEAFLKSLGVTESE